MRRPDKAVGRSFPGEPDDPSRRTFRSLKRLVQSSGFCRWSACRSTCRSTWVHLPVRRPIHLQTPGCTPRPPSLCLDRSVRALSCPGDPEATH